MSKNLFGLSKVLAAAAVCAVCASASAATLRVGTEATYAPFEFSEGENGQVTGYDIDIIKAIAKINGDTVEVRNMPFDGLIPGLMTGDIDVVIAAMTITPERAKKVDFTDSYYKSGLSILIREEDQNKYKKVDDLKGQRLCAQIGTTGAMAANKISPNNVGTYNTEPEAFMELKGKGCEGVVNDRPVNAYFLTKSASKGVMEMSEKITAEDYGIAVKKGNTELLKTLNDGLKQIKASGEFAKISQKWFGTAE